MMIRYGAMALGVIACIVAVVFLVLWIQKNRVTDTNNSEPPKTASEETGRPGREASMMATFEPDVIVQLRTGVDGRGACLSVPDGNNGSPITAEDCNAVDARQQWKYDSNRQYIRSAFSSCLTLNAGDGVEGYVCRPSPNDNASQRWAYRLDSGRIEHLQTRRCLTVDLDGDVNAPPCSEAPTPVAWNIVKVPKTLQRLSIEE